MISRTWETEIVSAQQNLASRDNSVWGLRGRDVSTLAKTIPNLQLVRNNNGSFSLQMSMDAEYVLSALVAVGGGPACDHLVPNCIWMYSAFRKAKFVSTAVDSLIQDYMVTLMTDVDPEAYASMVVEHGLELTNKG
jgi:hypothetical protein